MREREKKTPFGRGHGYMDITLYDPESNTKKTRVAVFLSIRGMQQRFPSTERKQMMIIFLNDQTL